MESGSRGESLIMLASRGDWLDALPDPLVLLLTVVLAGLMLWYVTTRSDNRMRHELRNDRANPLTGRALAALPAPVVRTLTVGLAVLMVGYGISRVV